MKLFIILAVIGACSTAGLNRQYLPAQSSLGSSQSSFGNSGQSSFGSGGHSSFGSSGQSSFGGSSQSSFGSSSQSSFGTGGHSSIAGSGQSSFGSSGQSSFGTSGQSSFSGSAIQSNRPQQAAEKHAAILKLDSKVTAEGFHYAYETENGIRAEETGNAGGSQGGFSYKGDDGHTYTITFTAGEGGFQAQGAHIPVAPPIPEDILKGLEQNARDEAAGIHDDGKYRAQEHGGGQYTHQASGFHGNKGSSFQSSSSSFSSGGHQQSFNAQTGYKY